MTLRRRGAILSNTSIPVLRIVGGIRVRGVELDAERTILIATWLLGSGYVQFKCQIFLEEVVLNGGVCLGSTGKFWVVFDFRLCVPYAYVIVT